ncbi:glycosyltransferase family 2 protein [Brucella anthropi]|nr:glycosyltransferase family 2 protein [Brucella anthropi]
MFTISIVAYNPDLSEFHTSLSTLAEALTPFDPSSVAITIIDNSTNDLISSIIESQLANWKTTLINGQGNIGFGRAHNLALKHSGEFHLILNPDIEMERSALHNAINFMLANPDCGLLSPCAYWPSGKRQYLCKRYPAVFDLLLRGFMPKRIQLLFDHRLSHYEMRRETQQAIYWDPPIVSGCFMLFRGDILRELKGFDSRYMLYFEDFDISLRAAKLSHSTYVPSVQIIHNGGNAARKGLWHILQFLRSAVIFFTSHNIKLF